MSNYSKLFVFGVEGSNKARVFLFQFHFFFFIYLAFEAGGFELGIIAQENNDNRGITGRVACPQIDLSGCCNLVDQQTLWFLLQFKETKRILC